MSRSINTCRQPVNQLKYILNTCLTIPFEVKLIDLDICKCQGQLIPVGQPVNQLKYILNTCLTIPFEVKFIYM